MTEIAYNVFLISKTISYDYYYYYWLKLLGKQTREDVKLKNRIDTKYDSSTEETVLSPKSPFGPLSHTTSKKTFLYLLGTLNAVYPDYDFGDISPELFSKMPSISLVVHRVANAMLVHFGSSRVSVEESIWSAIDQVINTKVQNCTLNR